MRVLFVGDVVGAPGRRAVEERLRALREELAADFCIVNGENVADGAGITPKLADKLLAAGADVLTLGNHVWRRVEIADYLRSSERVVRPANLAPNVPGRGLVVVDGVAVINLLGSLYINPHRSPFDVVDELVEEARAQTKVVIVDLHAEATSEKVAMPIYLDGRVSAVVGTHTHIQTNDARLLPKGTAAISDVGMTGPHDSVIGVKADIAIRRMRTGMPERFEVATGDVRIEGVTIDVNPETGRATRIEPVRVRL